VNSAHHLLECDVFTIQMSLPFKKLLKKLVFTKKNIYTIYIIKLVFFLKIKIKIIQINFFLEI
jgi:hypothetical protein